MGYTVEFNYTFDITPPLTAAHAAFLKAFSHSRRMQRDAASLEQRPDPLRVAVGLPVGPEGAFYVDDAAPAVNENRPPSGQPGLWCDWRPSASGTELGIEASNPEYDEWLEYLITHFFGPWGYVLNGQVEWRGDDWEDHGTLELVDNVLTIHS